MKLILKTILWCIAFTLFPKLSAQFVRPISSDAMYMQLRSMETGPWEFSPDHYYYTWVKRHRKIAFIEWTWHEPGLGVHDRGAFGSGVSIFGKADGYVNKYKPNEKVRAKMLVLANLTQKTYEKVSEKYKEIGDRETLDVVDRQVNGAIKLYESRFNDLYNEIGMLCRYLDQNTKINSLVFKEELNRIRGNVSFIGKSYIRNAERSSAYLKEIKGLEKLSLRIKIACKQAYARNKVSTQSI